MPIAVQLRQIAYSVNGGVGERECLDLSDRMLAAVARAQARMTGGEPVLAAASER